MVVQGHAGKAVVRDDVPDHFVAKGEISWTGGIDPDARALSDDPIVRSVVPNNRVLEHPVRQLGRRLWGWRVRSQSDSAVEGVVMHGVAGEEVAERRSGFIAEKNSAGIQIDFVVRQSRMVHSDQMNPLAAVLSFACFKSGLTGATGSGVVEALIIVRDVVFRDDD